MKTNIGDTSGNTLTITEHQEPQGPVSVIEQPGAGIEKPAPAAQPYKFPPKTDDPKKHQLTGRATQKEYDRITEAIEVRKQVTGKHSDIVRLVLELMDRVESDWMNTFKLKKKK